MATFSQVVTVNFLIDGVWTDVTNLRPTYNCYLLGKTGGSDNPAITVNRTKKSGLPIITNAAQFDFFDPDAILNNENPYSPYYQKLTRGTNVRIILDGTTLYELILDVIKPTIGKVPTSTTVTIFCTGLWDLLDGDNKALNSPIHRSTIKVANLVDYWRMEEGSGSEGFASAMPDGAPAVLVGSVNFAADTSLGGSSALPTLSTDTYIAFPIRRFSFSSHWQLDWFFHLEAEMATDTVMMRIWTAGSSVAFWDIIFGNNTHRVRGYDGFGTILVDTGGFSTPAFLTSGWSHIRFMVRDNGGGTQEYNYVEFPVPIATGAFLSNTYSDSFGRPYYAQILANANLQGIGYGHVSMYNDYNFSAVDQSGQGYSGERAATRFARLGVEEGIATTLTGSSADTIPMGPQRPLPVLDLLKECAETDGGLVVDNRTSLALALVTRVAMYSQPATVALSYADSHLSEPFYPVIGGPSDTTIMNDIIADRPNGGQQRYVIPDDDYNHWTTQDPPDGVYTREGKITVNPADDSYLDELAAWAAHLAAWKEVRISEITVELARSAILADAALSASLRSLGVSGLLSVDTTGMSRWMPPGEVRVLMEGRTDRISKFAHSITYNTRPADPYEVPTVNTSGSSLVLPLDTSATSMKVDTSTGPPWSETDEPYNWQADGEAMRLTSITTDTPAFIATGTAAHADNASVTPGLPAGMTVDVGQLLVGFAFIRNTGTGVPNLPSGYTQIALHNNILVFGKYYVTGDAAPVVSFTGGAAGATCSAVLTGWSGLSLYLDDGKYNVNNPSPAKNTSGSSDSIAYRALSIRRAKTVAMIIGWKQDDHTGVSAVAGFTEAFDLFTATGSDQSLFMQYQVQGSATDITAGSVTASGAVSAITASMALALRPLQTATVSRAANTVSISHSVGATVRGWRMGVNGL